MQIAVNGHLHRDAVKLKGAALGQKRMMRKEELRVAQSKSSAQEERELLKRKFRCAPLDSDARRSGVIQKIG